MWGSQNSLPRKLTNGKNERHVFEIGQSRVYIMFASKVYTLLGFWEQRRTHSQNPTEKLDLLPPAANVQVYLNKWTDGPTVFAMSMMAIVNNATFSIDPWGIPLSCWCGWDGLWQRWTKKWWSRMKFDKNKGRLPLSFHQWRFQRIPKHHVVSKAFSKSKRTEVQCWHMLKVFWIWCSSCTRWSTTEQWLWKPQWAMEKRSWFSRINTGQGLTTCSIVLQTYLIEETDL